MCSEADSGKSHMGAHQSIEYKKPWSEAQWNKVTRRSLDAANGRCNLPDARGAGVLNARSGAERGDPLRAPSE